MLQEPAARTTPRLAWIFLAILIVFTAGVRLRMLGVPLERDEGEYAYAGQLILQGVPPYVQMYNMKMPGIYACYAAILAILGQTHQAIHLGLLLVNALTIVCVFFLGRQLLNTRGGLGAALVFAIFTLSPDMQGVFANAEHFVLLPMVAGMWLLVLGESTGRKWLLLGAGLLLGSAFMVKQHGAAFIAWGGLYLAGRTLWSNPRDARALLTRCGLFSIGALAPFLLGCAIFTALGVFQPFWFWTVTYAQQYVSQTALSEGWIRFKTNSPFHLSSATSPLWLLALLGLVLTPLLPRLRGRAFFLVGFLIFGLLAACPGLYFRKHYFLLMTPAIALLAGAAVVGLEMLFAQAGDGGGPRANWRAWVPLGAAMLAGVSSAGIMRGYLFSMSPTRISRYIYGSEPFPEALTIADYIRQHTSPQDRIAIIGSEPEILFYAKRRSSTGYIYMYPLMEPQAFARRMQEEMIKEIEANPPKMLVFVPMANSWERRPKSDPHVFEWFADFRTKHYERVGLIDMVTENTTREDWGAASHRSPLAKENWLAVYERVEKASP